MRIAMIHLSLTSEAGDPRMFFSLAQALRRAGHEVSIFTSQFDPKYFPHLHAGLSIKVIPPQRSLDSVRGATGIIGKIRERMERDRLFADAARRIGNAMGGGFDIVIAQNDPSYQLGIGYKKMNPSARFVWIMNNPPFYRTAKDNVLVDLASRAAAFLAKRNIYRYISGIDLIVVHDSERKKLVEEFPAPSVDLPIPVDFESFKAEVKTRIQGDKKVHLLSVGSLSPARKFEDIILAASDLRKWGYDTRVTLVCKDFWKDAAYKENLLRVAKDLGVENNVRFLFDGATEEELRAIQRESDVFVFPPKFRIANMSSFEAMAAGLPLVVSDATSVAEMVRDGKNAMVSKSGDPESIAQKIRALIDDPALCHRIALAGQEYVRENLNWDAYARKFLEAASGKRKQ